MPPLTLAQHAWGFAFIACLMGTAAAAGVGLGWLHERIRDRRSRR